MRLKKQISIILASVMLLAFVPVRAEQEETADMGTDWVQELLAQLEEPSEPEPTPEPLSIVYYNDEPEPTQQPYSLEPEKNIETVPYEIAVEEGETTLPQPGNPSIFATVQNDTWKTLFSEQFGDDYLMPYKKNSGGQKVSGKTNRLVVQETDLTLPGKNGLDVNITRKHDNQDYNESYTGIMGGHDTRQTRYCYKFNTNTNESFYIAFYTEDDMYRYLYRGGNLKELDASKQFTAWFSDNTQGQCYYFEDIASSLTQEAGTITLEYAGDEKMLEEDKEGSSGLSSHKLLPNKNGLGNNWSLVLPEAYLYRTSFDHEQYMKYNEYMGAFRGLDGVMNSFTGSINAEILRDGSTVITSSFQFTDSKNLSAECSYQTKTVNGVSYNFSVCDSNGLTYYFNNSAITPEDPEIRAKHPMYIVAIKDDYDNMLRYEYSGTSLSKIIDTYGREINFSRMEDGCQISYEDEAGQTQIISYTTQQLPPETLQNGSPIEGKPVDRFTVTNQNGDQTIYDSRQTQALCYYTTKGTPTLQKVQSIGKAAMDVRLGSNIERITYPTGAQTNYTYKCIYPVSQGTDVKSGVYAVEKQWDTVEGEPSSEVNYAFAEDSGDLIITETKNQTSEEYLETVSRYDVFGSLEQQQINLKKGNYASDYAITSYEYDQHNNITKRIADQFSQSNSSRLITTYEYSPSSHQLWRETTGDKQVIYNYHTVNSKITDKLASTQYLYKSGSNYVTDFKTVTELTADQKEIEYARSVKNGIVQSQTKYMYDTEGNVMQIQQWTGDTNKDGVLDENDGPVILNSAHTITPQKTTAVINRIPNVTNIDGQDEGDVSMAYQFNIFGYPTSQIDSYGTETKIAYDRVNRPTLYTFANGATRTIEYNIPQNYSIVTNEAGVQTKNIYDGLGRISSKQLKDGSAWRETAKYSYDKDSRIKEVIAYRDKDGSGSKEEYTYDALNRVKTKTVYELPNKKQYTETYYYGIENQKGSTVKKKTVAEDGSPAADQTEYYDTLGRKVKTEVGESNTQYAYDYLDRCISETDPNGNTTTIEYNTAGQITKTTNAAGDSVINAYDMAGQLVSQTDPKGSTAFYTYDKMGNKIQYLTPLGTNSKRKIKYFYNKNANMVRQDIVRGAAVSISTWYQYDAMGNIIAVTGNDGKKDSVIQYQYDTANRMTRMVSGLSNIQASLTGGTQYEYNPLGYVSKVTDPLGQSETYSDYDYAGNVQKYIDKNGDEIYYEYGLYGLKQQTARGKNEGKSLNYTSLGQVKQSNVTNIDGTATTEEYTYDAYGRIATYTSGGAVQNYTYDKNSNIKSYTLNEDSEIKNNINYAYNSVNQLTKLSANGIMTLYEYDKNGNVTNKKVGSDIETTYEYNDGNLITRMVNKKGSQVYNDYECSYLGDGSKLLETENGTFAKTYTYDKMGRLSSEAAQRSMLEMAYNKTYEYDASGNRVKSIQSDYDTDTREIVSYAYDGNNRLSGKSTVLANSTNTQSGEVTNYTSYFYDRNGNTTAEQTFSYTTGIQATASTIAGRSSGNSLRVYEYDSFNQLTAYSDGSSSAQYQYNANGLRTKKTVNGQSTGFIWNGTNLAAEKMNGQIKNTYTYDITGIHSTNQNGTIGIYQKNPHGDITSIVDSSGTKLNTYDYDAFGNEAINEETVANPFRYCGEYYDNESGNIYLRARYYNPGTGRFINEDPIRYSTNWYIYGNNNPLQYVDPSGLKPGDVFKTIDEAAIDAGNYLLTTTYENDQEMLGVIYEVDGGFTYYEAENLADDPMYGFTVEWDEIPLAVVHTHVYYDVDHPNNILSNPDNTTGPDGGSDTNFTDTTGIVIYGAMPTGILLKYSPGDENKSGTLIDTNLIVDPKYTTYQWYKDTLIWDFLDKRYPEIDKMDIIKAKVKNPNSSYDMLKELGVVK